MSEVLDNETAARLALLPHVLSASQRPTGARGVYAYWRVGSGVTVPAAAKYIEVK